MTRLLVAVGYWEAVAVVLLLVRLFTVMRFASFVRWAVELAVERPAETRLGERFESDPLVLVAGQLLRTLVAVTVVHELALETGDLMVLVALLPLVAPAVVRPGPLW